MSVYSATFFKHFKLSLKDVFCLSAYWAKHRRLTYEDIAAEMLRETGSNLGSHTLVDYMDYSRNVCTEHFLRHPPKIGDSGKVVQIDETLLTRGRVIEKQWCFRGTKQGTNKCFVVPVKRRDAATFLPLIRQYFVPGTTIVSDQWAAYSIIKDMSEGYQHETVNHSLHFIDPETGTYTSSTESLWQKFKEGRKSWYGTERTLLDLYMNKFTWKKLYGGTALYHLWSQKAEHYLPPPGSVWHCGITFGLLIGLPHDSPIFGMSLVWEALLQIFFQVFWPEIKVKYECKCNVSVNAQVHGKLASLPLTGTNHQSLPEVLQRLPLHLTPLNPVTAQQTVLRSIASVALDCCSTLPNNLLL